VEQGVAITTQVNNCAMQDAGQALKSKLFNRIAFGALNLGNLTGDHPTPMSTSDSPETFRSESLTLNRSAASSRVANRAVKVLIGAIGLSLMAHALTIVGTAGLSLIQLNQPSENAPLKVALVTAKPVETVTNAPVAVPTSAQAKPVKPKPVPKPVPVKLAAAEPVALEAPLVSPQQESVVEPEPVEVKQDAPAGAIPETPATQVPRPTAEEELNKQLERAAIQQPAMNAENAVAQTSRFDEYVMKGDRASMRIRYFASSSVVDGSGSYEFRRDGNKYSINGELQATGFFAEMFGGSIRQSIEGEVGQRHLKPVRATNLVGSNPKEELNVDWEQKKVSFTRNGNTRSEDLDPSATDVFSFIFGFAVTPPADSLSKFHIVTTRGQDQYRYEYIGEETIDSLGGPMLADHIVVYAVNKKNARYDAWLSRAHNLAPVKLKFPVANGRVMFEMTARAVSRD
jgi:hypothetical protein